MKKTLELIYLSGLWKADRGSIAKGVVSIKNKEDIVLRKFEDFLRKQNLKVKKRWTEGYSKVKDV